MGFEHKIDSGSVFPVDSKETETSRDYNGSAKIACPHCNNIVDLWISGWVNETKQNVKYLGFKFNPKDDQPKASVHKPEDAGLQTAPVKKKESATVPDDLDDDIPF